MPESKDPQEPSSNDLRNAQFGGGFINAENVNAGRIGGDILNFFFGQQTTTPVGNPDRPKNQRILLHRAHVPPACWRSLSLHPQNAARPLRPNGVQARLASNLGFTP
jgi:hypothetical protein